LSVLAGWELGKDSEPAERRREIISWRHCWSVGADRGGLCRAGRAINTDAFALEEFFAFSEAFQQRILLESFLSTTRRWWYPEYALDL